MNTTTNTPIGTRMLFLDDSGHPAPNHASKAVVIGGIAIPSSSVRALSRRIAGAKAHHFPNRRHPAEWEIKATDTIRPNAWKRRRNRSLVSSVIGILNGLDCTVYTASINKANMHHLMTQKTTMPLQLQALVQHFSVECRHRGEVGLIVVDRSSHNLDSHVSHSVASYVTPRRLPLHPTVYYADSTTSQAIQIADLISGTRRRSLEGDVHMQVLDNDFASFYPAALAGFRTHTNRRWTNRIVVF